MIDERRAKSNFGAPVGVAQKNKIKNIPEPQKGLGIKHLPAVMPAEQG